MVPVTGTAWPGRLGPVSLADPPASVISGSALQQISHVMFGPSAVPVLAKIELGSVHSPRSVTDPRPCLRVLDDRTPGSGR